MCAKLAASRLPSLVGRHKLTTPRARFHHRRAPGSHGLRRMCLTRANQKQLPAGTGDNEQSSSDEQEQKKQRFGFGFGFGFGRKGSSGSGTGQQRRKEPSSDPSSSTFDEADFSIEEELMRAPLRPWKEFFSSNAGIPPTREAWTQRIRLNFNYYSTNYALVTSAVTLVVALKQPSIFIGVFLSLLAGFASSRFWVATLAPAFQVLTGTEVALFSDLQGRNKELVITAEQNTKQVGSSLLSVAEKRILFRENAIRLTVGLSTISTLLLMSTPVRTIATIVSSTIVAAVLNFVHASLMKPNMGSSIAGLGGVRSRSELDQNLRTLWDVATGNNRRS